MIKKIPKEEFEALFEEIYNIKSSSNVKKEISYNLVKPVYTFYGYKFLKLFNKVSANISTLPVLIKDFEIEKLENFIETAHFGFDIENKYRFFVSIEERGILVIEEFLRENLINVENLHNYVVDNFKKIFENTLEILELNLNPVSPTFPKFYSLNILNIKFFAKTLDEDIAINVYLDESLFESENIAKYIFIPPSTKEQEGLSKLLNKVLS